MGAGGPRRRRSGGAAAAAVLVGLLALACSPGRPLPQAAAEEPENGAPRMTSPELTLRVVAPEVLAGESLPVEVTLRNPGSAALAVPDEESAASFEFVARPAGGGAARVLSARRARLDRDPNPAPVPAPPAADLAPGASRVYRADLARYALEPLAPGRYEVVAAWRTSGAAAESAPAWIAVVAPAVPAFASATSPSEDALATVFLHAAGARDTALCQRVSWSGRPPDGVTFRRARPGPSATGVATSAGTDPDELSLAGWWFAWIEAGTVGAGVAQRSATCVLAEPVPSALRDAALHPCGWQRPGANEATFAVLGTADDGSVALAWLSFSARTRKGAARTVPLPGAPRPVAWAVQFPRGADPAEADLVLVSHAAGVTRIERRAVSPRGAPGGRAEVLAERAGPFAALSLAPVAPEERPCVDVLLGPAARTGRMTFLRLPLAGGAPLLETSFDAPPPAGAAAPAWVLGPAEEDPPVAAAVHADRIVPRRVLAGAGDMPAVPASGARATAIRASGGSLWLQWAEDGAGVRLRKLE